MYDAFDLPINPADIFDDEPDPESISVPVEHEQELIEQLPF